MSHQVGDKVLRQVTIGRPETKRGTITEVYSGKPNGLGEKLTFYAVAWESGYVERGYLAEGLTREPVMVPTVRMGARGETHEG